MSKPFLLLLVLLCVFSLVLKANVSEGFDFKAHRKMSERAVQPGNSNLDNFLKNNFGDLPNGIDQTVNGKPVKRWIEDGAHFEDSPPQRVQEHFHNPTLPWGQAGLSTGGDSAVLWAQERNQDDGLGGGNHSWHDAREPYFKALTGTTKEVRDKDWAETFESLGRPRA